MDWCCRGMLLLLAVALWSRRRVNRALEILKYELLYRLKNVGRVPLCNCQRDRAPHYKTYSFFMCWRCMSILGSMYLLRYNQTVHDFVLGGMEKWTNTALTVTAMMLILPTMIDGVRQYGFNKESTNRRRIVTGIMVGIGFHIVKHHLLKN